MLVPKSRVHDRRGKAMAESFSLGKLRHAPQKEGGWEILRDPGWYFQRSWCPERMGRKHTLFFFFFFFSLISLIADGPHHYHPACGHKGSSHLSPVHALQFFYRDASSALLQLVNQWLNFTYSRSHVFRCLIGRSTPVAQSAPRNLLTRWDVSSIPANGIFLTKN